MDRGSQTPSLCPPGFSLIEGPDNIPILVPDYMVLATKAALESQSVRMELNADEAAPGPRPHNDRPYQHISEEQIEVPADPRFSDREALNLHAEIKALQATLGLSYKDAAHRLYMTEVAKLKTERETEYAFNSIRQEIDNTIVNEIYPPITKIDSQELDK